MSENSSSTNGLPIESLAELFSDDMLDLLTATGTNLMDTVGMDVISEVVLDVLTGRNIRASTETLTRRRIATLNLALVDLLFKGTKIQSDFVKQLPYIASNILETSNNKAEEWLANWALGLTGKGVQNVLRDDRSLIPGYRDIYIETCQEVVELSRLKFGELTGKMKLSTGVEIEIDWSIMLYLLNTVGAETLTIRGSEKSLYGKFFEKLILGSLLHILGFKYITLGNTDNMNHVFWLSSNSEKGRESDATLLLEPGRGVRFDIGFIGRGNTEISLDKVSRYRREVEIGGTHWYMATIIIVDRIGPNSNIQELANEIDGNIVQMSAGYWLKSIASVLNKAVGFEHPLLSMNDDDIEDYLRGQLIDVPLRDFMLKASDR